MGVSSEFSQSRSPGSVADLDSWRAWAFPAPTALSTWISEAIEEARLDDAHDVMAGKLSTEEFRNVWRGDPNQIVARHAGYPDGVSPYAEHAAKSASRRYKTGAAVSNGQSAIRVDKEKGVRGSAQHSGPAAGRRD